MGRTPALRPRRKRLTLTVGAIITEMPGTLAFAFRFLVVLCGIMALPILARDPVENDWQSDWETCERVILNGPHRDKPGTPAAQYCEGLRSLFKEPVVAGNSVSASQWFRRAAKQNHPSAQTALGYMYEEGMKVPRNDATAFWWYRKAAAQGHATALYKVGHAYELGMGTARDKVKAGQYFQKAADLGSSEAQEALDHRYNIDYFCCARPWSPGNPQKRR